MASLALTVLGRFGARLTSGPAISLPTKKTKLLLAYLALTPGGMHSREDLMALLWSDRGDEQAQASLRQAVWALRKRLGRADPSPFVADRETIRLDPAAVEVDAVEFEKLVAAGTREDLEQACALYRGDLLKGISVRDAPYEEWLFYERGRLRDLALLAFEQLLAFEREAGETEKAIETAQRLLKLDPAHEKTHRELMRLYADLGRQAAALEQYQHCRAALERELGIKPGAETEQLYQDILQRHGEPPRKAPALELPAKPSIAVLPFKNLSGDPEQEYFVDGFTDEIITELSRFRHLFVIASHSVFTYKSKAVKVQDVARELGVQYVLEGGVRREGEKLRISAQLIDATSGEHVWAERYDRRLDDIFVVQDEVTQKIVATVASWHSGALARAGLERAKRKVTDKLGAYDYYLLGLEKLNRSTQEDNGIARQLLEKAIELDPGFARPHAGLAFAHYFEWKSGWNDSPRESQKKAFKHATKAVALDPADAYAHWALGAINMSAKRFEQGIAEYERALALNPNDADVLAPWGRRLAYLGRAEEGVALIKKAMRLNPYYPLWYLMLLGTTNYAARRYEEAIEVLERMMTPTPESRLYLAASYAQLGRDAEARAVTGEILKEDPDFSSTQWAEIESYRDQADRDHLLDGLRKAGLPE